MGLSETLASMRQGRSDWEGESWARRWLWGEDDLGTGLREIASMLRRLSREAQVRRDESEATTIGVWSDLLVLREHWMQKGDDDDQQRAPAVVEDVDRVDACWRCSSAAYGYLVNKVFGLLPEEESEDDNVPLEEGEDVADSLFEKTIDLRCPSIKKVLYSNLNRKPYDGVARPNFFVAIDDRKRCVVAVRGTLDIGDVLTDLVGKARSFVMDPKTEDTVIAAHAGIADAADNTMTEAEDAILTALAGDCDELVFTGHSLGGGVALLCALQTQDRVKTGDPRKDKLVKVIRKKKGKHFKVRAVAFSPPAVVSMVDQAQAKDLPDLESYYVDDDVVPTLSYRSILTFAAQLDRIDEVLPRLQRLALILSKPIRGVLPLIGSRGEPPRFLFPPSQAAASSSSSSSLLVRTLDPVLTETYQESIRLAEGDPEAPLSSIPGKVVRLSPSKKGAFVDPIIAPQIIIKDRLLADHLPNAVQAALDDLLLAPPPEKKKQTTSHRRRPRRDLPLRGEHRRQRDPHR